MGGQHQNPYALSWENPKAGHAFAVCPSALLPSSQHRHCQMSAECGYLCFYRKSSAGRREKPSNVELRPCTIPLSSGLPCNQKSKVVRKSAEERAAG